MVGALSAHAYADAAAGSLCHEYGIVAHGDVVFPQIASAAHPIGHGDADEPARVLLHDHVVLEDAVRTGRDADTDGADVHHAVATNDGATKAFVGAVAAVDRDAIAGARRRRFQ